MNKLQTNDDTLFLLGMFGTRAIQLLNAREQIDTIPIESIVRIFKHLHSTFPKQWIKKIYLNYQFDNTSIEEWERHYKHFYKNHNE